MNTGRLADWKWFLKLSMIAFLFGAYVPLSLADSTDARCDIYPTGSDKPSARYFCVFSQRQGYITIDRADGVYYDFTPIGEAPGDYKDSHGQPVYRQSGLGQKGLIFKLKEESVYVYWDTSGLE